MLAALAYAFDVHEHLSIDAIKARQAEVEALYRRNPVSFVLLFMAVHIAALTLCLPGAVLSFALAGGAIFGTAMGTAVVITSLVIGDSLGFLLARYVLGDWVHRRFSRQAAAFDRGVERDGAFFLLTLRLIAVMPYFIVNLAMGLTRMPLKTFAPMSLLGLLPSTFLYVNAGSQLARIDSRSDVMSPTLVLSLLLLGVMPIAIRFGLRWWRREPPVQEV